MSKKETDLQKATKNQFQFINALDAMAQQKGLTKDQIIENIKEIFIRIYHKKIDPDANLKVVVDTERGRLDMYHIKKIVSEISEPYSEILASDKAVVKAGLKVGDEYEEPIDYSSFSDQIASQIKQQLIQRNREAEKSKIYSKFKGTINQAILATVSRVNENHVILDYGDTTAFLSEQEMVEGEQYHVGQKLYVYVTEIKEMAKNSPLVVSRSHPFLVKKLVEMNVEDVIDGNVEIVSVQRVPGRKTKIAVMSNHDEIDAVGAFIGVKGSRISNVLNELGNEKVEIILYSKNPVEYITNALSPAKILAVNYNDETKESLVIVPNDQFQMAVGKGGINVKLAVKLTKIKIDIKTVDWAKENQIPFEEIIHKTGKSSAPTREDIWGRRENLLNFEEGQHAELPKFDMQDLIDNHVEDTSTFDPIEMYEIEEETDVDSESLLGYLSDDGKPILSDDEDEEIVDIEEDIDPE